MQYIFLLAYTGALVIVFFRLGLSGRPLLFLIFPWFIQLVALNSGLFTPVRPGLLSSEWYVALFITVLVVGYFVAAPPREDSPSDFQNLDIQKSLIYFQVSCLAIGILGILFSLYQFAVGGGGLDVSTLREDKLDLYSQKAFAAKLSDYMSPFAICSFVLALSTRRVTGSSSHYRASIAGAWLYGASGLITSGGRIGVIFIAIIFVLALALRSGARLKISAVIKAILGVALLVVLLGGIFAATRSSGYILRPLEIMEATHGLGTEIQIPEAEPLAIVFESIVFSLSYIASPIYNMDLYFTLLGDAEPLWGAYSFPIVFNIAEVFLDDGYRWADERAIVFSPLADAGLFPNIWTTAIRDLRRDFGTFGAIVFALLYGMAVGWFFKRARQGEAAAYAVLVAMMLVGVFFPFISLLYMTSIFVPLVLLVGYFLFQKRGLYREVV